MLKKQNKRKEFNMLNQYVEVEYEGTDKVLTRSPVFDNVNVPIEVPGKLVGQQGMTLISFFLVYQNMKRKKLMWINAERCDIAAVCNHEVGTRTGGV